jgi:type III restriction enzyme
MMKKFVELLDIWTITLTELYNLPPTINPLETTPGITKSLYTEEWAMNSFEHKVILAIANTDSVERRHRNIERKWFALNGWINHYPDFIVKMKSGKIILIETKGDDRDNSDSKDKIILWSYWANKAWDNYRYMMIFDSNKLDWAYNFDEAIERLKSL